MGYILVTGGAGFIGSHVCKHLLLLGYKIIVIDNFNNDYDYRLKILNTYFSSQKNIEHDFLKKNKYENIKYIINQVHTSQNYIIYPINIADYIRMKNVFKKHKIICIIHLAASTGVRSSIKADKKYTKNNLDGTLNLLKLSYLFKVKKIIFSSSSSVYGTLNKQSFKETDVYNKVISYYAYTKLSCENLLFLYHYLYNINIIILRFFNVYGPRQRPDLVIYKFANLMNKNQPIYFFGNGLNSRDYTYINDIVASIIKSYYYLAEHNKIYEILNIGSTISISLQELVKILEFFLCTKAIIKKCNLSYSDMPYTCANIQKANKLINYHPKTNIIRGVYKFMNWFLHKK
jgi:UDP-glucuronate 4-epimerase